jgi:conjugal transfer pilus assembly protein TraE
MHIDIEKRTLTNLHGQRNFFIIISAVSLLIILIQSVTLFFKDEKVIISPPELKDSYWVTNKRFSQNYLDEMACFFAHLLLDVTKDSLPHQGEIALRYADPVFYGRLKAQFVKEIERINKDNVSTTFTTHNVKIFMEKLEVHVSGILSNYVGDKKVSSYAETYVVGFSNHKGRLLLKEFGVLASNNLNNQPSIVSDGSENGN